MSSDQNNYSNCHRNKNNSAKSTVSDMDRYGDGDIPEVDVNPYYKNVEPLPESSRPRRDGPGGN